VHLDDARRQRTWWLGWRSDEAEAGGGAAGAGRSRGATSRGRRTWFNSLGDDEAGEEERGEERGGRERFGGGRSDFYEDEAPSRGRGGSEFRRGGERSSVERGSFGGGQGSFSGSADVKRGDWQCSKCRANVFARKTECFKCGTPRGNAKGFFGPSGDDDW